MRTISFPAGCPAGVVDAPVPVPGPGQLLVRTEAVGVGVGLVRMLAAGEAVRPGGEVVGTVVAAGPDVAGFAAGDRVGGQGRLRPPVRGRRGGDLRAAVLGRPRRPGLDGVGGELVQRGVHALAPFGRLVAFSAGGGTVEAGSLLGGLKSVIGFSIGLVSRTKPDLVIQRRTELWELLAAGRLNPRHVDFPLEEITRAIDLVTTRSNLGCAVLRTR